MIKFYNDIIKNYDSDLEKLEKDLKKITKEIIIKISARENILMKFMREKENEIEEANNKILDFDEKKRILNTYFN